MNEILIQAENVKKKFCRDLKRSLLYGLKDVFSEIIGKNTINKELRNDEFWAVEGVSFELKRGECLGLIGKNGAGKSTLLKILNGIIKPDHGCITMHGRIGALIELGAGFNPILTGRENIYNNAALIGIQKQEVDNRFDEIVQFAEIEEFLDAPVQNYSSGMKVRLGFAVAAHLKPDILIVDEVLAVGDLGFVIKCLNRLADIIPKTATIFVTHNMQMMARICTQVMVMNKGTVDYYSNDIAKGIIRYIQLFEPPKRINQGTGEIELKKIWIMNPASKEYENDTTVVLSTFDDLMLKVELEITSSVSEYELFILTFDGQLRQTLSSSSKTFCEPFTNQGDNIRAYKIQVPKLILATGRYSITFGAIDPHTKRFYCRITNCIYFTMNAMSITWATSYAPGEWMEMTSLTECTTANT